MTARCTACGACLLTCPEGALLPAPRRPLVDAGRCTACGECVEICPRGRDLPDVTHPIEVESYRRLEERVSLAHLSPGVRAVVARVIHATADIEFAGSLQLTEAAVTSGVDALRAGAPVVVDVEMVRAGVSGVPTVCFLGRVPSGRGGDTRSALAIELAAEEHPDGAVFVVGCAPTALEKIVDLVEGGRLRPALVVGVPVGFVGAAEAKERLRRTVGVRTISNSGERGGSPVAAAIVNALARLVGQSGPSM